MIQGISASEGISIGKIYKYSQIEPVVERNEISDIHWEIDRLMDSLAKSEKDLISLQEQMKDKVNDDTAAIFGAHIEILNDPELVEGVKQKIQEGKVNADYALKMVSDSFVAIFEGMEDDYFRERATDIKDITKRILMHLQGLKNTSLSEINEPVIITAKDLTPSDTAQLNRLFVKGFITDIGGRTSHSAIMARTLEIPAIVGTGTAFDTLTDGDVVILNGYTGEIIINPSQVEIDECNKQIKAYQQEKQEWNKFINKTSHTKDGHTIEIGANIGNSQDIDSVIKNGAECIGLYRTEFLYMDKKDYPSEEEQYMAYKHVLEAMDNKSVVIRTLDIGGDKELDYMPMDKEMNPFLGNRALRFCLDHPSIFTTQLRALLRASVHGNLHIMFPMIATLEELRDAKELLTSIRDDLAGEGYEISDSYKVGMMIEIPAAALLADKFAKEVDFFSIGTNDLIQYTFAADRMNEKVTYLYQPFNPSLIRLIDGVIKAAHKEGKWVGMCGEMAGDVKALPLLLGLGLDEFSMSASLIAKSRYLVSKIDINEVEKLAEQALDCESSQQVENILNIHMKRLESR